jgi:hypothetical protein
VLPLGRLTLLVWTVVAIAEPAARPNRMLEIPRVDFSGKLNDFAMT